MLIKIKDLDEFTVKTACYGTDSCFKPFYEVLAIMQYRRRKSYLVDDDNMLHWWDTDLFEIIDESVPEKWISIHYKRFHRYKNKKYNFYIPVNHYHGPKEFLDNPDFFFDIFEEPFDAHRFYCKHYKLKAD